MSFRLGERGTELERLHQAGSLRALFPRDLGEGRTVVLTNTSGGVTGGDRFRTAITLNEGAAVTVTTQAAERAYRARPGETGRVETRLSVGTGGRLDWLPQETILFEGSNLERRLRVDLADGASALIVEPLVMGRAAMGEVLNDCRFSDGIDVRRDGAPLYLDRVLLNGDMAERMRRPAIGGAAGAMALAVFVQARAEAFLDRVRGLLPETAGASLVRHDVLVARVLAPDGYLLRRTLIPLIELLHDGDLPRPWMI